MKDFKANNLTTEIKMGDRILKAVGAEILNCTG